MACYVVLDEVEYSSSPGKIYQIRRGGDGVLYCSTSEGRVCQGWLSNKNAHRKMRQEHLPAECKHTKSFVARTGASYGPQYDAPKVKYQAPYKPGKAAAVPQMQSTPAPTNWRDVFLKEQAAAAARGVHTPAAMLAEFKSEVGRFANLDVDMGETEISAAAPSGRRALDVDA